MNNAVAFIAECFFGIAGAAVLSAEPLTGLVLCAVVFLIEYVTKERTNSGGRFAEPQDGAVAVNKTTSLLLCLFLGVFGAHRFYEKKPVTAILYLFTLGGFFGGWLADLASIVFAPGPRYFVVIREKAESAHRAKVESGLAPLYEERVSHISGLDEVQGASCQAQVYSDRMIVSTQSGEYKIPMCRIRSAENIDSVDKKIINGGGTGRAIVWSFLAGPAAGIAASGNRVQNIDVHRYFTAVNYVSADGAEQCLVFENDVPDSIRIRIRKNGKQGAFAYTAPLVQIIRRYACAGKVEREL